MSTTPSTEIHFGPSWMLNSNRRSALKSQSSTPATEDQSSYSSIIRDPLAASDAQHANGSETSSYDQSTKPFRYSKEFMLGLWDGEKAEGLVTEFERYVVVFQEEAGRPVAFSELSEKEKKLFSLPFNPDRRPQATPQSSTNDIQKSELSNRRSRPGESRLTLNTVSAFAGGAGSLNSPARERFSGIQGGVLGGLGASGVAGGAGLGVSDGRLGAIGRGERLRRNVSGGVGEAASLPPSSQNSWRPTRQMSSNLLPQADENNPETASPQATPTRKWRGTVAAGEEEEASAPGTGERGGGFGAAARPGGWRERERIKKAEGELSSGAGWNTVGKDGETKRDSSSTPLNGSPTNASFAGTANAYSALQQDGDASFAQSEQMADAPEPKPSAAELEKEIMAKVMWTYKDPTGAVQGPFSAQNMQDWHGQGYFPPSLLVKRETDNVYETVATLTLLAPDESLIFFQRAPVPPAPPGLLPTPGFSPTPLVSPINPHNYNVQDPNQNNHIEPDSLDQFLAGRSAAELDSRWGSKEIPPRHQLDPQSQQQAPQQPFASGPQSFQQVLSPGGVFDQGPLGYGHRSTAPRHLAFNDPAVFQQSPYASPIAQHAQPSPWNQHAQPRFFGGMDQGPAPTAGFGYQPMNQLAPGAGWGANEWRGSPIQSPALPMAHIQAQQHHQQQQQAYAQEQLNAALQAQQQAQHQQQHQQQQVPHAWGSPAPQVAQPIQQQQAPAQAFVAQPAQPSPVSQWSKPLSQLSISSPVVAAAQLVAEVIAPVQVVEEIVEQIEVPQVKAPTPAQTEVSVAALSNTTSTSATKKTAKAAAKAEKIAIAEKIAAAAASIEQSSQPPSSSASPVPKIAPWARIDDEDAPKVVAPGPSLREIQESEARRAAAVKAARPAPQVVAPPASVASPVSWAVPSSKPSTPTTTPSGPVWQTGGPAPSRTLKQIQEEEQKQKAKAAQIKAAQIMALGGSVLTKAAYAGALANANAAAANSNANGAWSTVGGNGKAVPGASKPVALPSSVPPRPPTQSTVKPAPAAVAPSVNKIRSAALEDIAPSTEFLTWAKTALKSVTGVNIDEFLQMLLTFPLNPDSAVLEIISDSVYAHSSTLDGRRFANEFVTKRKADAKAQKAGTIAPAGRGSSLADIVKAQPKPVDTGFGAFKVVKKKGKKN